jgi:hypothetical protein
MLSLAVTPVVFLEVSIFHLPVEDGITGVLKQNVQRFILSNFLVAFAIVISQLLCEIIERSKSKLIDFKAD